MIYTDIFHTHKIGMFLGASLAVHAAVLSHWSASADNVTVTPSTHSVRMVLSTAMEAVETATTVPPVSAANAPEIKGLPSAVEANPPALTAPPIMPLADLDTAISTAFQFVDAVQLAAVKVAKRSKPTPIKQLQLAALPAPVKKPRPHKLKPVLPVQQRSVVSMQTTRKTSATPEKSELQLASAAVIKPAFVPAPAVNKKSTANNTSEVSIVDLSFLSALLHKEILQHRRYPNRAKRRRREGITNVRFQLLPSGEFRDISLGTSSGSNSLDRAALAAVKQTSPLAQAGQYLTRAQVFSVNVVFKLR